MQTGLQVTCCRLTHLKFGKRKAAMNDVCFFFHKNRNRHWNIRGLWTRTASVPLMENIHAIRFTANTDFDIDYLFLMHCGIKKGANWVIICPHFNPTMYQKRIINAKISICNKPYVHLKITSKIDQIWSKKTPLTIMWTLWRLPPFSTLDEWLAMTFRW